MSVDPSAGGGRRRMPVIGLAGGIGAGKSEVGRVFSALGCVVSDSDAEARSALREEEVRRTLTSWWGPGIYGADGTPDRAAIGRIVFVDADARRRLEGLIHPRLKAVRAGLREEADRRGATAFVIDAPLLFEAGLDADCDAVVFVDAPRSERLARVSRTRGWDEAELSRREAAQWAVEDKRARSGYIVINTTDRIDLERQVRAVLGAILSRPSQSV